MIRWLTGFDQATLDAHLADGTSFADDPLMRQIRYLEKLVDELVRGKAMEKVLRS